jgi:Carboxypeptidase regulatory-like domain
MRLMGIVLTLVLIFSPLAAHSQTNCITGVVVDNVGQPIKGIRVGLAEHTWNGDQYPAGEAVTDESGGFEIDGLAPGQYLIGAGSWAYRSELRPISVAASGPCTTITYNAGPRTAQLKLAVTDAVTNKPILDGLLHVSPEGQQGSWQSLGDMLRAGIPDPHVPSLVKLRIEITARGYSSFVVEFPALRPGETRELTAKLTPKNLGCIIGTAVDDSHAPVKGATIDPRFLGNTFAGDQPTVLTDHEGRFKAERLRPGDYDLLPENESDGFSRLWVGWLGQAELPKVLRVTVPATGPCKHVTINMGARGAWMTVNAVDDATQEQLSEIVVAFMNAEHARQGGSVSLGAPREVLVPSHARFTVQVRAAGYHPSEPVRVDPLIPGEKKQLTVPLQREASPPPTAGPS